MSLKKWATCSAIRLGFRFPIEIETARGLANLKTLLAELRIDCVVDVGANRGQFAESLRLLGFAGHIISFEPVERDFKILGDRFLKDQMWHGYQIALGEDEGTAPINVVPNATVFNSFLPGAVPLGNNLETETVTVRRLDAVLPEIIRSTGVSRIFLKMDTQGYDLKCFAGSSGCTHHILGLLSELSVQPIYQGMPHYLESLRQYEAAGFQLVSLTEVSRRDGAAQEYDCLMRMPKA
jgi:FkbM family methyltransferase